MKISHKRQYSISLYTHGNESRIIRMYGVYYLFVSVLSSFHPDTKITEICIRSFSTNNRIQFVLVKQDILRVPMNNIKININKNMNIISHICHITVRIKTLFIHSVRKE